MSHNLIPIVTLRGSPLERGRQHGMAFAAAIQAAIQEMKARHADTVWMAAHQRAERSWLRLLTIAPDVAEEIRGIADGSSCAPLDVYMRSGFEFFLKPSATGCSSVAASEADRALLGQNWDAPAGTERELVLFMHVGEQGFEQALVTSVGMLGWVGCNRAGLSFVTNDLMVDRAGDGIPSQVARRMILNQKTASDAVAILASVPQMSGRCYLIGDATGEVRGVEISPAGGVHALMEQRIAHTNHALIADIQIYEDHQALNKIYPSSRHRLDALRRIGGNISTAADVAYMLRNTDGAPDAVSKSVSASEPTRTAFSIIFDCSARSLHICRGLPSENDYQTVKYIEQAEHEHALLAHC